MCDAAFSGSQRTAVEFLAECDRASVEREHFYKTVVEYHAPIDSSDCSLGDRSLLSAWLDRTAQEQEDESSNDDMVDQAHVPMSSWTAMVPTMRALRKTFMEKRHERKPNSTRADRSSNCGVAPRC